MSKRLGWLHPKADGNTTNDQADKPDWGDAPRGQRTETHRCGLTGRDCPAAGSPDCPSC